MTQNNCEAVEFSLKNRKKAYGAMCKATILLLVFSVLSEASSEAIVLVMDRFSFAVQKFLVKIVCLFGVDSHTALIVIRNLMLSEAFYEVLQMFTSMFTMTVPALIFAKAAHIKSDEYFNVKGKCIKGILPMMGLCRMITTFVILFSTFITAVFINPVFNRSFTSAADISAPEFNLFEFVIMILSYAVFVPVIEEFMFRGIIFSYLKRFGTAYAVVASSLIFGIAHASPEQSVFAYSFGIISAFVFVVTGNIKTSIILHAVNNFIYVVENYTVNFRSNMIVSAICFLVFGAGIAGVYYTFRKDGYMDTFRKNMNTIDKEAVILPGIREVITLPVVVYLIFYVIGFVTEMVG